MESNPRKRDAARLRSSLILLAEPQAPDAPKGFCRWCGGAIVLVDPVAGYRFKQRTYHRGDEHETGDRNCDQEQARSRCWSARDALRLIASREGRNLDCASCGVLLLRPDQLKYQCVTPWEADHIVPLEDGGVHELANFQALCVPCHIDKTAREARERALRRRGQTELEAA